MNDVNENVDTAVVAEESTIMMMELLVVKLLENRNAGIDKEAVNNVEQTEAEGPNDENAENVDENVKAANANETLVN